MSGDLAVTVFDVGHGDAILIRFPDRSVGIIDCCTDGHGRNPLLDALREMGSPHIRFVCLTHPHADHCRGLPEILDEYSGQIDQFWHTMTDLQEALTLYKDAAVYEDTEEGGVLLDPSEKYLEYEVRPVVNTLHRALTLLGNKVSRIRQFQIVSTFKTGGLDVEILSVSPFASDLREYADCVYSHITCGNPKQEALDSTMINCVSAALIMAVSCADKTWSIAFTGDLVGEKMKSAAQLIKRSKTLGRFLPVDAFKSPHHGATDSVYDGLWPEWVHRPGVVLVSAKGGRHPSREHVESLRTERGVRCFSTGLGKVCPDRDHPDFDAWEIVRRDILPGYGPDKCCGTVHLSLRQDDHGDWSVEMTPNDPPSFCPVCSS